MVLGYLAMTKENPIMVPERQRRGKKQVIITAKQYSTGKRPKALTPPHADSPPLSADSQTQKNEYPLDSPEYYPTSNSPYP